MSFVKITRRMSAILVAGTLATTAMFGADKANATVLEWNVDAIFVNDSSSLTGTFLYNDVSDEFSNVDLTLTGSIAVGPGPVSFTQIGPFSNGSNGRFLMAVPSTANLSDLTGEHTIGFQLFSLANFATVGALDPRDFNIDLKECSVALCNSPGRLERTDEDTIVFRSTVAIVPPVSVVPVPAALPLFGTGLAIMGFVGWRRKQKALAA